MKRHLMDIPFWQDLKDEVVDRSPAKSPGYDELHAKQLRMLGRFARNDVDEAKWRHLEDCRGLPCKHPNCLAACWFGERGELLQLQEQAAQLLRDSGLPLWFVTITNRRYRTKKLKNVSLAAMRLTLRRALAKLEKRHGRIYVFGAIEASYEISRSGKRRWGPHYHFALAGQVMRKELRKELGPYDRKRRPVQCGKKRIHRKEKAIYIREVTDLNNLLDYNLKRCPAQRRAYTAKNGRQERDKFPVSAEQELEHDLWLLSLKPTDRLLLRGMKRVHGKLSFIKPRN